MKKFSLIMLAILIIFTSSCQKKARTPFAISDYKSQEIIDLINKVNYYFQENFETGTNQWDNAVYHSGNIRAFLLTGNMDFYNYSSEYSKRYAYLVNQGKDTVNGDNYCISQTYIDLYRILDKEYILEDVLRNANYNVDGKLTNFEWIDLVYMALPVYADLTNITGDTKYIDDAYRAYLETREKIWDVEEGLFYRDTRFIESKTPNGKKVLWSRGNGWAFAGLAKTLAILDKTHESYETYLLDFKQMAKSLQERQREDGTWNSNLDDPDHFGGIETSGTVMFMYGYALALKHGFLEETYYDTLKKSYDGLVENAISQEGRLLYVQPVADSPQMYSNYDDEEARRDSTKQYAVGIFIMAAAEMASMCIDYKPVNISIEEDDESFKIDPDFYKGKIRVTANREEKGNEASKLVDGVWDNIDGHRWSAPSFNSSADLVFEDFLHIEKIIVVPHQGRAYKYTIEASLDGKNFEQVVDFTDNILERAFFSHDLDIEAKAIRITVVGAEYYQGQWVSINEILVYEGK